MRKMIGGAVLALVLGTVVDLGRAQANQQESVEDEVQALKMRVRQLEAVVLRLQERLDGTIDSSTPGSGTVSDPEGPDGAPETSTTQAAAPASPDTLRVYWDDTLRLDSADDKFQLKLGGRLQNDWAFFSADREVENAVGALQDGTEFRRARLYLSGTIYDHVEYKAQFDFAGAESAFKDTYVGIKDVPGLGTIRFGHQKEPFSLEELTSSKHLTFLERSLGNVFAPSRNTGILIQNGAFDERVTWAAGVFRDSDDAATSVRDSGYNVTARLTGLPWYQDEGEKLLHLGIAYSRQDSPLGAVRYRQRPESHLALHFVNTGVLFADSAHLLGLETALVNGRFSLQSEFMRSRLDAPAGPDPSFTGFYVEGGFFLTQDHRNYKTSSAAFDRVSPESNFFEKSGRGRGAWELAARYSRLDLNDAGVRGGELNDFSFGVNWFLNPNTRWMWNYVFSDLDGVGDANILQTRIQVEF